MIDTHTHLTGSVLWPDRQLILQRCRLAKVRAMINICLSMQELQRAEELVGNDPLIFHAAAIHPTDESFDQGYFDHIGQWAEKGELVAIGETGLDYVRSALAPKEQIARFLRHIELALKARLPLIIHCRGAFQDLIEQLQCHYLKDPQALPGLLHCFSEGPKELALLVEMGWSVGFGGLATYPKAADVQRAVAIAPSSSFVLETDSPYLTPQCRRKERNDPSFIPLIAKHLAALRDESVEQIAKASTFNARRLFPALK